jgi:hypothetical protein
MSQSTPPFPHGRHSYAVVLGVLLFVLSGCAGFTSSSGPKTAPGALSVSASSFAFKTVVVGQTANQSLTVTNSGQSPIQLTALGVSNQEFAITGPSVPRTILPANSLTYTVSFSPTTSGSATGALQISSDVPGVSESVSLTGSGEKAFANLVLTPPSINFGNLAVKSTSTQNVTMQNTGDVPMTVQGITVAGAGFGYSSVSPGLSLAPNQRVTFQVWFNPKAAGVASATVTFLSPNLSSPGTMSLSGDGIGTTSPSTPPTSSPTTPPASHSVHLSWGASPSNVAGYRVYRSEASGASFTPLNGTLLNVLSYDDTSVSLGTTYYYVVTAVDGSGNESIHSNQVTAVIPAT